MPKGKLYDLAPTISSWFEDRIPYAYSFDEISTLLEQKRTEWKIPTYIHAGRFLQFLLANTPLKELTIQSVGQRKQSDIVRYIWRLSNPFLLGTTLKRRTYCSHFSAMVLHGLTNQIPQTFILTVQQRPIGPTGELTQNAIDRAFSGKQRESQIGYRAFGVRYVMLEGTFASKEDVEDIKIESSRIPLAVSSIERTLIDIVVRPSYSGGIFQILEAYKAARGRLDTSRMYTIFRRLSFTYPYQQPIGFMLSKAGYLDHEIQPFLETISPFNFYLAYGLVEKVFIPKWKLYIPRGFE